MENDWVDRTPHWIDGGPVGVLLIHGLAGTPAEMRPVESALEGHTIYNMLLPGHGVSSVQYDRHAWLTAVREAYVRLSRRCDHVFVVGLSTGALLGALLATEVELRGLVLLAPGMKIANPKFRLIPIARFFMDQIPEANRPHAGLTSINGWKGLWHFSQRSTFALNQLRLLQQEVRQVADQIGCPSLIIQGELDQTCDPDGARELLAAMPGGTQMVSLPMSGHCLTMDVEQHLVMDEVLGFINAHS